MRLLDEVLSQVADKRPPMRNLSGDLVAVRSRRRLGFMPLPAKAPMPAQGEDQRISAPPEPLIQELTTSEATMLIERHMEFEDTDRFGITRTVRLGLPFVSAYKALHESKLPICVAVSTAPLVSPDFGEAGHGRWPRPALGIFYQIDPVAEMRAGSRDNHGKKGDQRL